MKTSSQKMDMVHKEINDWIKYCLVCMKDIDMLVDKLSFDKKDYYKKVRLLDKKEGLLITIDVLQNLNLSVTKIQMWGES